MTTKQFLQQYIVSDLKWEFYCADKLKANYKDTVSHIDFLDTIIEDNGYVSDWEFDFNIPDTIKILESLN